MSTKNLVRSAFERGKRGSTKFEARYTHREERVQLRIWLSNTRKNPDFALSEDAPKRLRFWPETDYNFSPLRRWLERQVGRSWAEVNADIARNFTHYYILHTLRRWVNLYSDHRVRYSDFIIDEQGILQFGTWLKEYRELRKRAHRGLSMARTISEGEINAWRNGRKIKRCGKRYHWFMLVPARMPWPATEYRQDRRLSPREMKYFVLFSDEQRREIILS